ncbi:DUF3100 domain-containing protein [Kineococcus arenarius]|uniref:DUF3100 domain-containing protein n=1 Tax=Kineococcus sp. SYSU DK007 TaxID=3383128 RepID=UPI003D7D62EA
MASTDATTTAPASPARVGLIHAWPVLLLALAISAVCEVIGQVSLDVGIGAIVLFPMVWGILIGTLVSVQKFKPMGLTSQKVASAVVAAAVMFLVARLAFNIGPSLPTLVEAGPALLLQEVGHLLGTIFLALPLAVALRMGRSTVGATFSLDREPSFAIVSEKYGADSDEYRGVLGMYVFGTLFGAVYITLLASFISSLDVFDPLALAMGAGVGSGSMMAAATGSIIAEYPAQEQAITAMAAVANLLTTVLGVYVGIYIALPLARRMYAAMTRGRDNATASPSGMLGEHRPDKASVGQDEANRSFREQFAAASATVTLPLIISIPAIVGIGIVTASIAAGAFSWDIVIGYAEITALVVLSLILGKVTRVISPIIWITTLGALASSPWSPIGESLATSVSSISLLSLATIMLTTAGLSLGKDIPLLRSIGWKMIPVGLVAITASFVLSAVIAEFALGFWS